MRAQVADQGTSRELKALSKLHFHSNALDLHPFSIYNAIKVLASILVVIKKITFCKIDLTPKINLCYKF